MATKINKSKIRRDIAKELADAFIDAVVATEAEYSCLASVFGFCNKAALEHANKLLAQGINLSKSNYPFTWAGNMKDMFLMDAAKIVHKHYYG